jgi:hypothetical protein
MTYKHIAIGSVVVVLVAFAAGRYSVPIKTVTKTVTVEVEKKVEKTNTDSKTRRHTTTTITETKTKDGTTSRVTKIDTVVGETENSSSTTDLSLHVDSKTEKEVTRGSSPVTISALAGLQLGLPPTPVYGISVTKPVFGPIAVGAWGLSNRTIGGSLGLTF